MAHDVGLGRELEQGYYITGNELILFIARARSNIAT